MEYDSHNHPVRVDTVVVSTQHDDFILPEQGKCQEEADAEMLEVIRRDVENVLIPRVKANLPEEIRALWGNDIKLHVNPTGKFVIGGPHGDTGLTGRKIIVDTYGGRGAHGGGAFSGKDPSKVDRSAAYAARHIAKNLVAAGVAEEALVQVAYAIGVAQPVSLYVNTRGTAKVNMTDGEISRIVGTIFDMRPNAIEKRLKLRNPIYLETATYGHIGRTPRTAKKHSTPPCSAPKPSRSNCSPGRNSTTLTACAKPSTSPSNKADIPDLQTYNRRCVGDSGSTLFCASTPAGYTTAYINII